MRTVLWILGLFAAAVAAALVAVSNDGTVSIFLPHRRIDLSLNLALLVLVLSFALVHAALNALTKLFELPAQSRQWRSLQRERGAHAALLDAWIYWRAGRYVRAREAARVALAREQSLRDAGESLHHGAAMQALAHTLLAESAYALREPQEREAQLQQGLAVSRDSGSTHLLTETQHGLQLRAAQWALIERDPERAQRLVHDMGRGARRRTAALRVLAQAAEMAGRPLEAFELTRLLRKHGDLSDAASLRLLLPLAEAAAAQTTSLKVLRAIWQQLADWQGERDEGGERERASADDAEAQAEAGAKAETEAEDWRLRMATGLRLTRRALALAAGSSASQPGSPSASPSASQSASQSANTAANLSMPSPSAHADLRPSASQGASQASPNSPTHPAQAQADAWLHQLWDSAMRDPSRLSATLWEDLVDTLEALLVARHGRPEEQVWLTRIEAAHGAAPQEAGLQYLAGMVALSRSAWDDARKRLALAARGLPSPRLQRRAWRALARLAESQDRTDEARLAWQQAAMVD
ncbi:hypothetical protein CCO03_11685 [Comamonas serinivorans]|uniref:HemY N-terminal domain-containing protein n=1 Tax=Comamonas serinivorans TaxID=1082851 RepID=A0A1Y0EPC6_9BURK|nr:heme biosynthesis HemY N-terminal domain-containing protein [Comamonas serinivorans]ARU05251.1 hypothetical protein CCO03_11685 [Comamonas serinivorans]